MYLYRLGSLSLLRDRLARSPRFLSASGPFFCRFVELSTGISSRRPMVQFRKWGCPVQSTRRTLAFAHPIRRNVEQLAPILLFSIRGNKTRQSLRLELTRHANTLPSQQLGWTEAPAQ